MVTPHRSRLAALRKLLSQSSAQAFLSTHAPNIFYLTGFSGSNAALLVTRSGAGLFTDARYKLQAKREVHGAAVKIVSGSLLAAVGKRVKGLGIRRVAIEAVHVSIAQKDQLERNLPKSCRLIATQGWVEGLRLTKGPLERDRIRESAALASAVFDEVLPLIRPGLREFELAAEIEYRMRRRGASGAAFETIVAFGDRTALPHARPTARRLRKNELVLLDWGAILCGYCSDLTRTLFVGRAPARVRGWYEAVRGAQAAAIEAVRPGALPQEVDRAARSYLERHGLARYFAHSTGHGLGLEVHEAPRLAAGQTQALRPGMVITIEPGIYVEGVGGIRIEDDLLVGPEGAEILTSARREFLEV